MFINLHTHHKQEIGLEIVQAKEVLSYPYSYGVGPFEIDMYLFDEKIAIEKNCISIGEIGLDKNIQLNISEQIIIFKKQLLFAEKLNLPVIIHCVKAYNELIEIKRSLNPIQPWIIHGFRKTNLLNTLLKEDFYISVGSAIIHDRKLQASIKTIPNNRLFLETDNDLNHNIEEVYQKVAFLKEISLLALKTIISNNFKTVFKKWEIG
ncbi:MAG: TatD family hydrolase [Crocinitomicaceae bacterium]|jgi:TatD DNase family protein